MMVHRPRMMWRMQTSSTTSSLVSTVFTREDLGSIHDPETKFDGAPFEGYEISYNKVEKKLKKLNPSKSPGQDGIQPRVLKETAD